MSYVFRRATETDAEYVFALTEARVHWMDQVGIRQWNVTNYLDAYPPAYYEEQQKAGNLYVLMKDDSIAGAVVLFEEDDRWPDRADSPVLYIHNLVTDPKEKGAGNILLQEVEKKAVAMGKKYLRLDCAVDNEFLNRYYGEHGFNLAGRCAEGLYVGNRREKML